MKVLYEYLRRHINPTEYHQMSHQLITNNSNNNNNNNNMSTMSANNGVSNTSHNNNNKVSSRHIISHDSIIINKELGVGEFGVVQQGLHLFY